MISKRIIYILILLLSATMCGKPENKKQPEITQISKIELVQQKYNIYKNLSLARQDANGFVEVDKCDSLLFSALLGVALPVNIEAARDSTGQWFRRPLNYEACYPNGAKSTISRDMLIGVLWYIWKNKDLNMAESLFSYGVEHFWIMGEGAASRIYFTPALQSVLAEIIYKLGGYNHYVYRALPQAYFKNTDFEAHLDILLILLKGELLNAVSDTEKDIIEHQRTRMPGNPLFQYAYHKYFDGDQGDTINLLLNTKYFPADRLPTTHDRCESWILQRDMGDDWVPCRTDEVPIIHSGGDFLFISHLILGK